LLKKRKSVEWVVNRRTADSRDSRDSSLTTAIDRRRNENENENDKRKIKSYLKHEAHELQNLELGDVLLPWAGHVEGGKEVVRVHNDVNERVEGRCEPAVT